MNSHICSMCGGTCKNQVHCACEICAKEKDVTFPYRKCGKCGNVVCHNCIKVKGKRHAWGSIIYDSGVQYVLECPGCKKAKLCIDVDIE